LRKPRVELRLATVLAVATRSINPNGHQSGMILVVYT
jgi:hypothetical protein